MAKLRTISAVLLGGALVISATGCASAAGAGEAEKSTSFTYWSMYKEGEPQQKVIAAAIDDFTKETGITVDAQWQGRDNVKKVVPTLNTRKVPDLIDGSFAKLAPILAETGQASDMSAAYDIDVEGSPASELIPQAYLDASGIVRDGKPWMLPVSLTTDAVWFDGAAHPDLVSAPPTTWKDFITFLDAEKKAGRTPIAIDGDVSGYNAYWYTSTIVRLAGPNALKDMAMDETGKAWDTPEALEAAQLVEDLVTGDYFVKGYNASKWPAQQQAWGDHKATLLFNGSWIPTETGPYAADGFEYASFPFPSLEGQKETLARADFIGFAIPENAAHKDAAAEFSAFLLGKKYQDAIGTEAKILPVREDAAVSPEQAGVHEALQAADAYYQQNGGITLSGYSEKLFWPASDKLVLGTMTAEEFVQEMKAGQIDYWKNNS